MSGRLITAGIGMLAVVIWAVVAGCASMGSATTSRPEITGRWVATGLAARAADEADVAVLTFTPDGYYSMVLIKDRNSSQDEQGKGMAGRWQPASLDGAVSQYFLELTKSPTATQPAYSVLLAPDGQTLTFTARGDIGILFHRDNALAEKVFAPITTVGSTMTAAATQPR